MSATLHAYVVCVHPPIEYLVVTIITMSRISQYIQIDMGLHYCILFDHVILLTIDIKWDR